MLWRAIFSDTKSCESVKKDTAFPMIYASVHLLTINEDHPLPMAVNFSFVCVLVLCMQNYFSEGMINKMHIKCILPVEYTNFFSLEIKLFFIQN